MATALQVLERLYAAVQTTKGTAYTTLEMIYPNRESSMVEIENPEMTDINLANGNYGKDAAVVGKVGTTANVEFYGRPTANTSAPEISNFMQCSGFTETTSAKSGYTEYIYTLGTTTKDMTIASQSGSALNSQKIIAQNVVYDAEISGEVGKPMLFKFAGIGALSALPANISMPVAGTPPTAAIPALIKLATMTVNGISVKLTKFSVKLNNKAERRIDAALDYGFGNTDIAERDPSFSATFYFDSSDAVITNALAGTQGTLEIVGALTAKYNISIKSTSHSQLKTFKKESANGESMWTVEGKLTADDLVVTLNK